MARGPLGPPTPAERRRIRRAAVWCGVGFGAGMFFLALISRLGCLRGTPWLQLDAPGPLDAGLWLRDGGTCLAGGLGFGYIFGKLLRFPDTPDDASV